MNSNMAANVNESKESITVNSQTSVGPKCILLFSGKRKSGKDHITDILYERLNKDESVVIKISKPIKARWAKSLNLDINELLGNGKYKEKYRLEMNKWGESIRNKDYGYFCRAAIDMYNAHNKSIWIVSDIRRKTDIKWFKENYGDICKTIRINSSEAVRQERGWTFIAGIDDSETECDLDDFESWNLELENNEIDVESIIQQLLHLINA